MAEPASPGGSTAGTIAGSGGVRRQAATGCGKYIYTMHSRMTVAWDVRAPSPCKPEDPTYSGVRVGGHVGSNISNVLELHRERPGNNGGV